MDFNISESITNTIFDIEIFDENQNNCTIKNCEGIQKFKTILGECNGFEIKKRNLQVKVFSKDKEQESIAMKFISYPFHPKEFQDYKEIKDELKNEIICEDCTLQKFITEKSRITRTLKKNTCKIEDPVFELKLQICDDISDEGTGKNFIVDIISDNSICHTQKFHGPFKKSTLYDKINFKSEECFKQANQKKSLDVQIRSGDTEDYSLCINQVYLRIPNGEFHPFF